MIDSSEIRIPEFDFETGEVLNIDKPLGMTSFGVVERIRRWTGCRKVGHAGTLDPLATGVLLVCTGRATKRVSEFMDLEKEYEGIVELGRATDTDDAEGKIIEEHPVPDFSEEEIESSLNSFRGTIDQTPPLYSALKKNGQRMYKLARRGNDVPRQPRSVTIHEITLLKWIRPELHIRVRCSRGTYIRALARDIGKTLGTGGYLKALRRTRIGQFQATDSYPLEAFRRRFCKQHESV